jgi:NAD(P)-dependent dehydrogenase (short-subunit alcohol dehydrogenase family)
MSDERFAGKIALVTGADRGTGQAQAQRLAAEGADVALLVLTGDAQETVNLVEKHGRRATVHTADQRDLEATQEAVDAAVAAHGGLDIVCATAGLNGGNAPMWELAPETFRAVLETNVFGTWHVLRAAVPHVLRRGPGGSIIVMGSTTDSRGVATASHYAASKHGVLGLMRSLAAELGPYGIRVNGIVPTNIDTVMFHNPETYALLLPDVPEPTREQINDAAAGWHELPVGWVGTEDVAAATAFLASAEARFTTGSSLHVDAGLLAKWPG